MVFESQIPNTAINGLHTVYNVYIVLIVHTVCTNHTAQTALHCLKSSSMFAFTYFKGRLERYWMGWWASEQNFVLEWVIGETVIPYAMLKRVVFFLSKTPWCLGGIWRKIWNLEILFWVESGVTQQIHKISQLYLRIIAIKNQRVSFPFLISSRDIFFRWIQLQISRKVKASKSSFDVNFIKIKYKI